MSQPSAPPMIRIKRKRDDAPLESLYIETALPQGKRRITDTYVFKRLNEVSQPVPPVRQQYDQDGIPMVRSTQAGEEKRDPFALGMVAAAVSMQECSAGAQDNILAPAMPRRFHLARPLTGAVFHGRRPKKSEVATFVEKRGLARVGLQYATNTQLPPTTNGLQNTEQKTFKRPSARARVMQRDMPPERITTGNMQIESDPSFTQKMNQWAQETEDQEQTTAASKLQSPHEPAPEPNGNEQMDLDNEADYVYDTYIRQHLPANTILPPTSAIGQLIISEEDQDLWETYLEGLDEDDKEFETDDEDSNAEDYYGADYPEDEVDEVDGFDKDLYQYRRHAADLEEFDVSHSDIEDEDKIARSDDEDEADDDLSAAKAWRNQFVRHNECG